MSVVMLGRIVALYFITCHTHALITIQDKRNSNRFHLFEVSFKRCIAAVMIPLVIVNANVEQINAAQQVEVLPSDLNRLKLGLRL